MFGAVAACRDKHRLQPGEPKPRPAEARKTRSAGFGTRTTPIPLSKPIIACELQNRRTRKTGAKNARQNKQFLIPTAPLRRQRTAESTTSLTRAVTRVTPGGVADRPDAPGHLRGSKRKPLPEIDRTAVFGFCLRPNSQSALISCSTLLVLRTASAEAANLAASSFVRSIFTIFSIPLRPMIAGTPMQMSSWPYSPSR